MKVTGRIHHLDIGTGVWQLVADDGRKFQLAGGDAGLRQAGLAVTVEGEVDKGKVGLGMSAPTLVVTSYETAGRATSL